MQRAVLAALTLARATATKYYLIDALWDDPPANAANVLQQYVSALRRQVGRAHVVTFPAGYDLNLAGAMSTWSCSGNWPTMRPAADARGI